MPSTNFLHKESLKLFLEFIYLSNNNKEKAIEEDFHYHTKDKFYISYRINSKRIYLYDPGYKIFRKRHFLEEQYFFLKELSFSEK